MKKADHRITYRFRAVAAVALALFVGNAACHADQIDWNRYCIDGVQLTGNYDVNYLLTEPRVKVTVAGKTQKEADGLVDDGKSTIITWSKGENVEIAIDLTTDRLVSGIVVLRGGETASWRMATSLDGKTWRRVPEECLVIVGDWYRGAKTLMAANLALPARYVRIHATPPKGGLWIRDIYIYGEKKADAPVIGGIYPSCFPPVTGKEVKLRAIIRNPGERPAKGVKVKFRQTAPEQKVLGEAVIENLPAGAARVASIRWKPTQTEPHNITVIASGQGLEESQRSEIIPVVNRQLYFANFHPVDNERLKYANLYTSAGGRESFSYFLGKIRGRLALSSCTGPHQSGEVGVEKFEKDWTEALKGPNRDGIGMDEWGTPHPGAVEALKRIYQKREGRIIVPWLAGGASEAYSKAFRFADLVLTEVYLNVSGHHTYRSRLNNNIDGARKWGLLDKWIIALGVVFTPGELSTAEEIEREVRYLRLRGPEMPGVGFYGYSRRDIARKNDELCYKYFISPVVVFKERARADGDSLSLTVRNIGGMTAHDVKVAAVHKADGRKMGATSVALLKPDEEETITINTTGDATKAAGKILLGEGYTALNPPQPLEVYPSSQVKGLPIRLCWTPENPADKGNPSDHLDFVNANTGEVDYSLTDPYTKGKWMMGNLYIEGIETSKLSPGRYNLRLVDGKTDHTKGLERLTVVSTAGKFYVSRVNDEPWTGDPQVLTINPGDTFDVSWDMRKCRLTNAAIYISAPGDNLRMPRQDGSYAAFRIWELIRRIKPVAEPEVVGSWRWKSAVKRDDLLVPPWKTDVGWIFYRGHIGPDLSRVNMSSNPGKWRLWIGGPTPAFPITPVVTVNVRPTAGLEHKVETREASPPAKKTSSSKGVIELKVDAPKTMTTGDIMLVKVNTRVLGDVVAGKNGCFIDRVDLFETAKAPTSPDRTPGLRLSTVRNPDKTARQFTAYFMIASPKPGRRYFSVRVGRPEKTLEFTMDVTPKEVFVGESDTISITSAVPTGVVDSNHYLHRLVLYTCHAAPEFGPRGNSGVIGLTNMAELIGGRGREVSQGFNPDLTTTPFHLKLKVGPSQKEGSVYYLVWYGYIGNRGNWMLVNVSFKAKAPP